MNDSIIQTNKISKIYGYGRNALTVLKDISLDIKAGEIISIMGPSGAGKSTLLNLIGCLDSFQRGVLHVMNRNVTNISVEALSGFRNSHMGFIFQLHNLLPEFTALENIMIPLLIRREKKKEVRDRAFDLLERFGLTDRASHLPSELSGGECQRIAVARAIVGKPDIILADEPTGSLDSKNSLALTEMLLKLVSEYGTTLIIVTHDQGLSDITQRRISLVDGIIENDEMLSK